MLGSAIEKLRAEMSVNQSNPYIQVIGDFLLNHINTNPDAAASVLPADKTISKSLEAMKNEAKKKQHNGMAMLTDVEGFAIVLKYFGIENNKKVNLAAAVTVSTPPPSIQSTSDFDVSLDELLGGL